MYIQPNTTIRILNNIRLLPDYNHSIYWGAYGDANAQARQANYFASHTKYTLTSNYYQRQGRGYLRIQVSADDLWDCSYIMFQNSSFGNKWFYAFITNVEYVNNITAEITYEIDVLQTWYFDYYMPTTFVEREHVNNDAMGLHTIPEDVVKGEVYYDFVESASILWPDYKVAVLCSFDYETIGEIDNTITPEWITGTMSALNVIVFNEVYDFSVFLDTVSDANKLDGIIAAYMIPRSVNTESSGDHHGYAYRTTSSYSPSYGSFEGYVPKNNKLFCYPYNYLMCANNQGDSQIYKYELFVNKMPSTIQFVTSFTIGGSPQMEFAVLGYNQEDVTPPGRTENNGATLQRLLCTDFPQVSTTGDAYKAWIAQHKTAILVETTSAMLDVISGAVNTALSAGTMQTTGGSAGGQSAMGGIKEMIGGIEKMGGIVAEMDAVKTLPPVTKTSGSSSIDVATRKCGFYVYNCYIRAEYAKIVDDYFSTFGYKVCVNKVPNECARANWTYVKTRNANPIGNMPADDKALIGKIYDKGITWWTNGDNLGNYGDMTNPII